MSNLTIDDAHRVRQNILSEGADEISLQGTFVSREAAETILTALCSRSCEVRELKMESCTMHGLPWPDKGIQAFTQWALGNSSLRSLDLSSNSLGDVGCEALVASLCGASSRKLFPSLETLKLDGNSLRDRGARSIASLLASTASITKLSLQQNELSNSGAVALSDALEQKRGGRPLKHMYLASNLIGTKGIAALLERQLATCDLSKNLVNSNAVQRLQQGRSNTGDCMASEHSVSAVNRTFDSGSSFSTQGSPSPPPQQQLSPPDRLDSARESRMDVNAFTSGGFGMHSARVAEIYRPFESSLGHVSGRLSTKEQSPPVHKSTGFFNDTFESASFVTSERSQTGRATLSHDTSADGKLDSLEGKVNTRVDAVAAAKARLQGLHTPSSKQESRQPALDRSEILGSASRRRTPILENALARWADVQEDMGIGPRTEPRSVEKATAHHAAYRPLSTGGTAARVKAEPSQDSVATSHATSHATSRDFSLNVSRTEISRQQYASQSGIADDVQLKYLQKQAALTRQEELISEKLRGIEAQEEASKHKLSRLQDDEERRENLVLNLQLQQEAADKRRTELLSLEARVTGREAEIERVEMLLSQHAGMLGHTGAQSASTKHGLVSYLLEELGTRLSEADVAKKVADDTREKCTERTQKLYEKDAEREEHWRNMVAQCEQDRDKVMAAQNAADDDKAKARKLAAEWERRVADFEAKKAEEESHSARERKVNSNAASRLQERESQYDVAMAELERTRAHLDAEAAAVGQERRSAEAELVELAEREQVVQAGMVEVSQRAAGVEAREVAAEQREVELQTLTAVHGEAETSLQRRHSEMHEALSGHRQQERELADQSAQHAAGAAQLQELQAGLERAQAEVVQRETAVGEAERRAELQHAQLEQSRQEVHAVHEDQSRALREEAAELQEKLHKEDGRLQAKLAELNGWEETLGRQAVRTARYGPRHAAAAV